MFVMYVCMHLKSVKIKTFGRGMTQKKTISNKAPEMSGAEIHKNINTYT